MSSENLTAQNAQDLDVNKELVEKSQKPSIVSFLIQFIFIAIAFFAIGFAVGQKKIEVEKRGFVPKINVTSQFPPVNQNLDFSLFWEVFNTLPEKYLDKSAIDSQNLLYGAISGMVRSLGDPYTAFVNPKQNELIRSEIEGEYEGIGIQIGFNEDKRLAVIAPLSNTPAERAGVLAKDIIVKIDKETTIDLTLPEAAEKIRGEKGTTVKLELLREENGEETLEVEIERAKIDIKTIEVQYQQVEGKEIAIVKVSRFAQNTDSEWDTAINEIANRDTKGVIIDMRNNPGGLLSGSIHSASDFIKGTVVKQEFANGSTQSLPTDKQPKLPNTPLVVLVNEGSASAAEIFAGAIQDTKRGKIIGMQTFGKGSVQDVVDLPGGSALHVTVAKWLTPKGSSIQDVGISPDIVVELTRDDRENERDPQLDRALEEIT